MRRWLVLLLVLSLPLPVAAQTSLGQATLSPATTLQSAVTANGNGTVLPVFGYTTATLTVNCSSCSGGTTVNFEATEDGTNYAAINGLQVAASPTLAATTTTAGLTYWTIPVSGFRSLRARVSAYSAGTITVTGHASPLSTMALLVGLATGTNTIGSVKITDGTTTQVTDPCNGNAKTTVAISQTADTKIISQVSAKKNYICSIVIVVGAAEIVGIVEGTGTVCGTNKAAIVGSTTDANSMSFAANGGFAAVGGNATTIAGTGTNVDTCLMQSGSNRVSGYLTYVQQ